MSEYDNISVYSNTTEINIDGLDILLIPWINQENEKETYNLIKKTKCSVAMGHLELNGFRATPGHMMEHGASLEPYQNFEKVYSGHYHTRSDNGKIYYLGNPYELFWNDVNQIRGFHIFDTSTKEHTPVNNPYKLFHILYYLSLIHI